MPTLLAAELAQHGRTVQGLRDKDRAADPPPAVEEVEEDLAHARVSVGLEELAFECLLQSRVALKLGPIAREHIQCE